MISFENITYSRVKNVDGLYISFQEAYKITHDGTGGEKYEATGQYKAVISKDKAAKKVVVEIVDGKSFVDIFEKVKASGFKTYGKYI